MDQPTPPPAIDYAPPLTAWQRRRFLVRTVYLLTLIALGFFAYRFGPAAWERATFWNLRRSCLGYDSRPDRVVFEEDATKAAALSGGDSRYRADGPAGPAGAVMRPNAAWDDFHARVAPPGRTPRPVAFLGERHQPNGLRRLVALEMARRPKGYGLALTLIDPGDSFGPATVIRSAELSDTWVLDPPYDGPLRLFEGVADPADPTHFVLRYEAGATVTTVDGWLLDRNHVRLEIRETPDAAAGDTPTPP